MINNENLWNSGSAERFFKYSCSADVETFHFLYGLATKIRNVNFAF